MYIIIIIIINKKKEDLFIKGVLPGQQHRVTTIVKIIEIKNTDI